MTHTLEVPGAVLTYDVREPEQSGSGRPLFIFGSPMGASAGMPPFEPDAAALRGSSVRVVPAIGEAGEGTFAQKLREVLE